MPSQSASITGCHLHVHVHILFGQTIPDLVHAIIPNKILLRNGNLEVTKQICYLIVAKMAFIPLSAAVLKQYIHTCSYPQIY